MNDLSFSYYQQRFLEYASSFCTTPEAAPLRLKVEHTLKVFEHARHIVDSISCDPGESRWASDLEACRAALLAALFHDIGRFCQFQKYKTFMDASSVNHAYLGMSILREQQIFREERPNVRRLALCAVLLHNRHQISPRLSPSARFATDIVRDSDKLDIFRIMVTHLENALPERDAVFLHVKDDPDCWTPAVADDVFHGKVARYADLRFVNDFRILLGSWMYELRFLETRRALAESGLMDKVLAGLPDDPALCPVKNKLNVLLEGYRQKDRKGQVCALCS